MSQWRWRVGASAWAILENTTLVVLVHYLETSLNRPRHEAKRAWKRFTVQPFRHTNTSHSACSRHLLWIKFCVLTHLLCMILTTPANHTFIPSMLHNHTILLIFPQKSTWRCCRSVAHAPRTFPFPGHALRHGCLHSCGVWQLVVSGSTFLTFIWPWW